MWITGRREGSRRYGLIFVEGNIRICQILRLNKGKFASVAVNTIMKKLSAFLILSLCVSLLYASGDTANFYWVQLKDKKGTPYQLSEPEKFLSSRSLERRRKNNVTVSEEDLPVNPDYISQIAATGAKVHNRSRWFNAVFVNVQNPAQLEAIKKLSFVSEVKPLGKPVIKKKETSAGSLMDMLMSLSSSSSSDKADYHEGYGKAYDQVNMLNGVNMHKMGFKGKNVVIAVLDAGFPKANKLPAFEMARNQSRILGSWDFVMQDTNVYDDDNHGLNVLSCMAAVIDGEMIGTAPEASYWLLRTEDAGSEYPIEEANWICGAEFADSVGADVINSSLGYTDFDDKKMSYSYSSLDGRTTISSKAATLASRKGIIVCNAAGNEGASDWKYIGTPADADGIISVGGVDKKREHASFSSYGPTADGRLKPTVCAKAEGSYVVSLTNKVYPSQGTSFASPILCGMVACLVQANPGKTVQEVMNAINKSSDRYSNPDNTYGYGIPDFVLANRILGGDVTFDYNKDQLVPEPAAKLEGVLNLTYYAAQDQEIMVTLKGKDVNEKKTFQVKKGEFTNLTLGNSTLPPGEYHLKVIGKTKLSYTFTVSEN